MLVNNFKANFICIDIMDFVIKQKFLMLGWIVKLNNCLIYQGRMQDFSWGGAQLKKILEVRYTCRKAACREQRSCEPLLGGFGGMLPQENF